MAWNIILITPVYATFFWAVVLHTTDRRKQPARFFLGHFMLAAFVVYLSHMFYFLPNPGVYHYLDVFYMLAYLLVYPLFHIYVRLLSRDTGFSFRKHFKFLIAPLVIFIVYLIVSLLINYQGVISDKTALYLFRIKIFQFSRIVFIVQVILFLYLNFRFILRHHNQLQNDFSNPEPHRLTWILYFNICMSVTSFASIIIAVMGRDAFLQSTEYLTLVSFTFSLMLFVIGLLGSKQSQFIPSEASIPEAQLAASEDSFQVNLKMRMDELFEKDMIFLDPHLKIWDLSGMLGTNRTYVSRLINQAYNRNFCSHVNHYRAKHAQKLIAKNPSMTNEQIADLSGFGSVNSLYRAVNACNGKSIKQLKKTV